MLLQTYSLVCILLVVFSCDKKDEELSGIGNKLDVSEFKIGYIGYDYVDVKVKIDNLNKAKILEYGYCWDTKPNPDTSYFILRINIFSSNIVSKAVNRLSSGTTYYLKVYFIIGNNIIYSEEEIEFKTKEILVPSLNTKEIANISILSCRSGGIVYNSNGGNISEQGVCWNTSGNPTIEDSLATDTLLSQDFNCEVTNLKSNTKYFIRAYAINEAGVGYGNELNCTTANGIPSVKTENVMNIVADGAQCGGSSINDCGYLIVEKGICWNTMGNPEVDDFKSVFGDGNEDFLCNLENLDVNTKYYIRAYAKNEIGTGYGDEIIFSTQNGIPDIQISQLLNILSKTAEINVSINDDGGLGVLEKGVCWNKVGDPTINDDSTRIYTQFSNNTNGIENYIFSLKNLNINTTYFIRPYIKNKIGIHYGMEKTFSTQNGIPQIYTSDIVNARSESAQSGGENIHDIGYPIIEKGICWNKNGNPTILDNRTIDGVGSENYSSELTGLTFGETYYVRAYAKNSNGVGYGAEKQISLVYGVIQIDDYDGNWYNTIRVGNQIWLKENLRTTHYSDATVISSGAGVKYIVNEEEPEYYFAYDDNEINIGTYGCLYTWYAAKKACPSGWHMPKKSDWDILFAHIGIYNVGKFKSIGTIDEGTGLWRFPNSGATNEYGFSIVPTGQRDCYLGYYFDIGKYVFYIFSDDFNNGYGFLFDSNGYTSFSNGSGDKNGYPVKCIKD